MFHQMVSDGFTENQIRRGPRTKVNRQANVAEMKSILETNKHIQKQTFNHKTFSVVSSKYFFLDFLRQQQWYPENPHQGRTACVFSTSEHLPSFAVFAWGSCHLPFSPVSAHVWAGPLLHPWPERGLSPTVLTMSLQRQPKPFSTTCFSGTWKLQSYVFFFLQTIIKYSLLEVKYDEFLSKCKNSGQWAYN